MISPLPMTPYRSRDSERSVSDIDQHMGDSEVSDFDQTPQRKSDLLDMPTFNSPKPHRPTYSKDLSQLASTSSEDTETSSPMKMLLKRNESSEWNVDECQASPDDISKEDVVLPDRPVFGKQPLKLDKVVLNLKKSAGNTWNIAEKKSESEQDPASCVPKEERRGRKSKKSVPMKIQNVEEIANDIPSPAQVEITSETSKIDKQTDLPKSPNDYSRNTIENSTLTKTVQSVDAGNKKKSTISRNLIEPTKQQKNSEVANISPEKPIKRLSTGITVTKTFQRKNRVNQKQFTPKTFNPIQKSQCQLPDNWKEIAEMSSKAAAAFKESEEFSEVSDLMKAATGVQNIDLGFVQKIQQKLSLKNTSRKSQVTFHVGQGKTSIDLPRFDEKGQPIDSMTLSDPMASIKINLSSDSDGITGNYLKMKEPEPLLYVEPKKRGRPKLKSSTRPASPPLSMVQQNNMYSRPSFDPAINVAAPPAGWDSLDNFFNNPLNIQLFNAQLNIMMQGFEQPPDALTYNIDPILNMMLTRAQDVAYASINFDALIYLYAKIKNREWMMQNNQAYANYGYCNNSNEQSQSLDLSTKGSTSTTAIAPTTGSSLHKSKSNNVNSNDRTYAELQTVRSGGKAIDATQVLRQHQEASSEPTASTSSEASVTKSVEVPSKEDEVQTVENNPITRYDFT